MSISSDFLFSTAAVKMFELLVHYANTGTETLSPFVDSSVDNILFPTNPDFTSRFLNLSTLLNVIWYTHCFMAVKPCNRPAVGAHRSGEMKFIDVFCSF